MRIQDSFRASLFASLACSAGLLQNVGTASAQNLIVDPGFESGSTITTISTPWRSTGCIGCIWSIITTFTTNAPHSGTYQAVLAGSSIGAMTQDLTVAKPGQYQFSFWAKKFSNSNAPTLTPVVGGVNLGGLNTFTTTYNQYSYSLALLTGPLAIVFNGDTWNAGPNNIFLDDIILICTSGVCAGLTAPLPANAPSNARAVATAIDKFVDDGGTLPTGFTALYDLTGAALTDALRQLAGEAGASGGQQGGTQLTNSFMSLLLNGFAGNRDSFGGFGPSATGYAAEKYISPEAASAYAALERAAGQPSPSARPWNIWASGYGGQSSARGDTSNGNGDTQATTYGYATGLDYRVAADGIVGFALAGGHTHWNAADGYGGGNGEVFQAGVYGSWQFGASYLSAAASYSWFNMTTNRTVTISGTDNLVADFSAHNIGGRIETGHRFATVASAGITPYVAAQTQTFHLPSYRESASSGSNQFAMAYSAQTAKTTRGEFGVWFDSRNPIGNTSVKLFSRLALAHDWRDTASVTASFQTLPGSSFTLNGAAPPQNMMLATAGFEVKLTEAVAITAKIDGEFGGGFQSYAGTGTLRYALN